MRIAIDLTNQRFGRLVALRREKAKGPVQWRCACKCGKICSVLSSNLRNGNTRSCGCLREPAPDAAPHQLFKSYRRGAKRNNRAFELSEESFRQIIKRDCFYCGAPPARRKTKRGTHDEFEFNGVDRLDNSRGYSPDNCVAACKICNAMKATHSPVFFISHIEKISRKTQTQKPESKPRK